MTHDEAHERAEERASESVEALLSAAGVPRTTATEHMALNIAQRAITAYLAAMEAAGFVVARVPGKAYPNTVEGADWCGGFNTAIAAMLASRPKVTP